MLIGELGELLETEMLPLALPAEVGRNCAVKLELCPGWIVRPAANPLMVKAVPLTLAWEIVTAADPVFDRFRVAVPLLPTTTPLKLTAAGETPNPGTVPVPVSAIVIGEFGALLATEILPVAFPAEVGKNCVVKLKLWPGWTVCPAGDPTMLNPVPVILAWLIVTLAVPGLDKFSDTDPLAPTTTFPKLTDAGVLARAGCVPAPVKGMVIGELGALLATEIVPVAFPADVGENFVVKLTLCPGWIVCPLGAPTMVKPVPLTLTWPMATLADPLLDKLTDADPLDPTTTFPKPTDEGALARPACVPDPVNAIVMGEFGALLATEMLPVALPTDVGKNCAVKLKLCPGWIVCPFGDPIMVKPVPLTLAWLIVTLADPVLDRFNETDPIAPTTTLPKLTDAGVLARPGCVPVPVNATERGEFDASLATVKLPVALPVACGANAICTVTLCPTASDPEGLPEATV
jgi:hypothetical protein